MSDDFVSSLPQGSGPVHLTLTPMKSCISREPGGLRAPKKEGGGMHVRILTVNVCCVLKHSNTLGLGEGLPNMEKDYSSQN